MTFLSPFQGFIRFLYDVSFDELGHLRHVFLNVFVDGFLGLLGRLGQLDAGTHHFCQSFVLLGIELQYLLIAFAKDFCPLVDKIIIFFKIFFKKYLQIIKDGIHFFVLLGSLCHIIAVWDVLMQYV